ncbi:acylphosphatase [Natronogracilivirga saccharolytica]|uniref:acylphosphatase n=1 Tax=Natronogracilivirga saccharolytica TaxID=2812953 RepID=A0A8J7RRJ1_9BACT|nr:acylphosphatase [Natronogracilivirga saccharolytica]MBP3192584.1 acylphosphatase [Natronogracilivirga saccharolytica]
MSHIVTHLLHIYGRVQGVGFRNYVNQHANERSVTGWIRNREDGSVEVMLQGKHSDVGSVEAACRKGPPLAKVDHVDRYPVDPDVSYETFEVRD